MKFISLIAILIGIVFLFSGNEIKAQWDDPDSLKNVIANSDNDTVIAHNYNKLSFLYNGINLDSSLFFAERGYEYASEILYDLEINRSYKHFGRCYAQLHKYNLALHYLERALILDSSYLNEGALAETFLMLGNVYRYMERYSLALEFDSLAYSIFKMFPKDQVIYYNIAACLVNIGRDHYELDQMDSAVAYYSRFINHIGREGNAYFLFYYYARMGDVYFEDPVTYDLAKSYYDTASHYANVSGQSNELGYLNNRLGKISIETGQYDLALKFLGEATSYADKHGSADMYLENIKYFADYFNAIGEAEEANKFMLELIDLKDSIFKKDNAVMLAEFEVIHRTMEKENQILVLEEDKLQERIQRILFTTMAIVAGFIILLIIIYIRWRGIKTKNEKKKLNDELDLKERELTSNALSLVKRNEVLTQTSDRLSGSISKLKEENQLIIRQIVNDLKMELSDSAWGDFEMRFLRVHPDFYSRLRNEFPDISPAELKLASLIRLGMSTKEIASITGLTSRSVEVSRSRLRKRINLPSEKNLQSFLGRY